MDIVSVGAIKPVFLPLALELYQRYLAGETIKNLSDQLGIPVDRIEVRIRAAAAHIARQETVSRSSQIADSLGESARTVRAR